MHILFVCLGNICRSPTAEGVMRTLAHDAGVAGRVELDSAGTGSWHIGEAPDERAIAAAKRRGIALSGSARQVGAEDFERFDLIVAMDRSNLADLERMAPSPAARARLWLLRDFEAPGGAGRDAGHGGRDVPDPYHGGPADFDRMVEIVERACAGLLDHVAGMLAGEDRVAVGEAGDASAGAFPEAHGGAAALGSGGGSGR
ncbi:MAG: low molecular weight phosphotyrosine protein phosphatase [Acidobacteriota bacterium]|nr:low molecular weight phosphotyrosine protein phosphatase [Acidobacteriota bacterium]